MKQIRTQESRDVQPPNADVIERIFIGSGAITIVCTIVAIKIGVMPTLSVAAVVCGVVFGIVNLRWWRIIVRALLSSNQATTGARKSFFIINLAFKVLLLLLVFFGLSRWDKEITRSFLIGFVGFLSAGGATLVIMLLLHRELPVDSERPNT